MNMTSKDVVKLFREKFPDLKIHSLRYVEGWYVFTVSNGPIDTVNGVEVHIDPYIGYNIQTQKFKQVLPFQVGGQKFFKARTIPFE